MDATDGPEADGQDPFLRTTDTFPTLTEGQLDRVRRFSIEESVSDGQVLFARGERAVDVFVVLDGALQILDVDHDGTCRLLTRYTRGQFTGELDRLSDQRALVSARALGPGRVLRLSRAQFRRLLSAEPDIGETVLRAFIRRRLGLIWHGAASTLVIGPGSDAHTIRLQRFLEANSHPFRLLDTERHPDELGSYTSGIAAASLPVVVAPGGRWMACPSNVDLAEALGLTECRDDAHVHDLIVVGAGPAGLAAAVYAASEGVDTLIVEAHAPGGQAGASSRIENYLGFPTGISGHALAARAQVQAQKFGAHLLVPRRAIALDCAGPHPVLTLDDGRRAAARAVIIATGARYRRIEAENYERFEGVGIHYAATPVEARLCRGCAVLVIGAGNSAGQAAVYLSRYAARVHLLVRGTSLSASMSSYLVDRIAATDGVTVHLACELREVHGAREVERVTWRNARADAVETHEVRHLFVMIGAEPNTEWLGSCVAQCPRGFVVTGDSIAHGTSTYATSLPGVFAVGDARAGSVKRVAAGVGEGAGVVQAVHAHLAGRAT